MLTRTSHLVGDSRSVSVSIYWVNYVFIGEYRPEDSAFQVLQEILSCLKLDILLHSRVTMSH